MLEALIHRQEPLYGNRKKRDIEKINLFSNGEKISSLFDELFLIEYELKKTWCSGLHTVFFKEVVD